MAKHAISVRVNNYPRLVGAFVFIGFVALWCNVFVGSFDEVLFSSDAYNYVHRSAEALTPDWFPGYRSYLPFALTRAVVWVGSLAGFDSLRGTGTEAWSPAYTTGAVAIFLASGLALIAAFGDRKNFWLPFLSLSLNPILFVNALYPLQEGLFILVAVPLLLATIFTRKILVKSALVGILAGILWMIKSSFLLPAIVVLLYGVWINLKNKQSKRDIFSAHNSGYIFFYYTCCSSVSQLRIRVSV